MSRLRTVLGLVVSAVFLWAALQGQSLSDVWDTLTHANYIWIIPGILTYFLAVVARTWRWHYMLRSIQPVPLRTLFPIVTIGYMGNNIYPARAGEVLRAYVLKKRAGVSMSASLATVVIERLFDGVVMLLFVFVSLPRLEVLPDWLRQIVVLGSVVFLGALVVFFALAARPARAQALYRWLIEKTIPIEFQGRVHGLADRFMGGLSALRRERDVLMIFATSLVIWLLETVKYWFVMHAFPFEVSFYALMLMNGVGNLATTIPSSPGYVGTFDATGIAVLTAFRVDRSLATGYTLILHAALWFPITLLGLFFMARESIRWSDVNRAADTAEAGAVP
ncbi:MAG: flippase-like domain-containing protein [Chloroflexi bacterium]|nr:flippase-like domain-containing protein [Chloroflexota bacterium]MBI3734285.1 flippase-like domain-containing protein [Chloroflexota bacterium]